MGSKPDWFYVDEKTWTRVANLPGSKVMSRNQRILHRSMLPLVGTDEAENTRAILTYDRPDWKTRDAWADARGFKFRVTQHQAIDFGHGRRGLLIGDEMRLGKTVSALAQHDPDRGPLVIVAPLTTRAVWLGWAKRLFPGKEIGICVGKKYDPLIFNKDIVFLHYDVIAQWQSMRPVGTLIFDEAHVLTNRKTSRVVAAGLLQHSAAKVIALTGTPIWNMPTNMWALLGLIAPGAWGTFEEFGYRYGLPVPTGYGMTYTGSSNEAELNQRLQEIMIRRLWKDCADDVPAISRSVVVAEVSDVERRRLDILAGELSMSKGKSSTIANLAAYRQHVTGLKLTVAVKEAQKCLERGESVVLWTWHKDFAGRLHRTLGDRSYMIHGDVAPAKRDLLMDAWKADPEAKVLIATMSVAQVGIDLSRARIAIFAELDWTPAIIGQAEMRTFSPTRGMDVFYIVANHLTDQRIVRQLITKLAASAAFGVGAAGDAIDAMRDAIMGPIDSGDLDRLLEDLLASAE